MPVLPKLFLFGCVNPSALPLVCCLLLIARACLSLKECKWTAKLYGLPIVDASRQRTEIYTSTRRCMPPRHSSKADMPGPWVVRSVWRHVCLLLHAGRWRHLTARTPVTSLLSGPSLVYQYNDDETILVCKKGGVTALSVSILTSM